jgi:hypothetical protein
LRHRALDFKCFFLLVRHEKLAWDARVAATALAALIL